jgi:peptidoglycan hydrolase-like protein with peptidoglycan-binding domain
MKWLRFLFAAIFLSGLLIGSQALAGGQDAMKTEAAEMAGQAGAPSQQLNLNQEQTQELQRLLQNQGYDIGNADGVLDEDTMEALRQFQGSEGMAVTGTPNQQTLRALAPDSDQQEFFGLSPEFGEMGEKAMEPPAAPESKSY